MKKHLRRLKTNIRKRAKIILAVLFLLIIVGLSIFIYYFIFYKLPSPQSLKDYKIIPISTHIYDRNGKLLYEIYRDQNRTPIKLKDLPDYIPHATVAIEDKDFYHHNGIAPVSGIFRALREAVVNQSFQGGSTLTQQLVKGTLLSPERTPQRKLKEMVLAIQTEKTFNKEQILELYLNQIPYGGSAYGIEEASKKYFDKHATQLTLDEAALLAGLPQAPSLYSPLLNPDKALWRRNTVLQKMYEQKYITKKQLDQAKKAKINIVPPKIPIKAPHFVFFVKDLLEQQYTTKQVEEGGLRVYTTLDLDIQASSEAILKEELDKVKDLKVSNGAILVTRPTTGEILSMVGSVDYFASPSGTYNVTTALRQPGSSIKPLNYAVGIDRKLVTPATLFLDVPTCFSPAGAPKQYCPVNYDGQFHGAVRLRAALGNSFNIPAVKMLAMNGVREFVASASAFTISTFGDPDRYGLSLTLGGGEVRMTEMAQAFSAFANQGKVKTLNSILKVVDKNGKVLYEFKDQNYVKDIKQPLRMPTFLTIKGPQVISKETSYLISHILLDNAARSQAFGSSSFLVVPKKAVSVKTGTTDDKKDNWTIGYTPNFLTAVWVGNNDNTPMHPYLSSGITGAAPIWNRVMKVLLEKQPDLWPIKPETVVSSAICSDTGAIMTTGADGKPSCAVSGYDYYIKGTESKQAVSTKRETIPVFKDSDKQAKATDQNIEMKEKTVMHDHWSTYCLDCAHDGPTPTP